MFADSFDLMAAVVPGSRRSVHRAYQSSGIGVSAVAVYDELKGIEPSVCRALLRETAAAVATLMSGMPPAAAGRCGRGTARGSWPATPSPRPSAGSGRCGGCRPGRCRARAATKQDEGIVDYFRGTTWHGHAVADLRYHSVALVFFTDAAFRYWLPAFMLAALGDAETADVIPESIELRIAAGTSSRFAQKPV